MKLMDKYQKLHWYAKEKEINTKDLDFVTWRSIAVAKMSKDKGRRGERELAAKLREHGYDCRRGQQYAGANGDADVVGLPGIHAECKRTERLDLSGAMSQSIADAREGEIPAVYHRKNNAPWLVTMRLDDWIGLYREWEAGTKLR